MIHVHKCASFGLYAWKHGTYKKKTWEDNDPCPQNVVVLGYNKSK